MQTKAIENYIARHEGLYSGPMMTWYSEVVNKKKLNDSEDLCLSGEYDIDINITEADTKEAIFKQTILSLLVSRYIGRDDIYQYDRLFKSIMNCSWSAKDAPTDLIRPKKGTKGKIKELFKTFPDHQKLGWDGEQKLSRFYNGIFQDIFGEHPEYQKKMTALMDILSPTSQKTLVVISWDPIDYLNMSKGNSWKSCMGERPLTTCQAAYDDVTYVAYCIPANSPKPYHDVPKYRRMLIHKNEEGVIFNRQYPQRSSIIANFDDAVIDLLLKNNVIQNKTKCQDARISKYITKDEHCDVYLDISSSSERDYGIFAIGQFSKSMIYGKKLEVPFSTQQYHPDFNIASEKWVTLSDGRRLPDYDTKQIDGVFYAKNDLKVCPKCGVYYFDKHSCDETIGNILNELGKIYDLSKLSNRRRVINV